MQNIRDFTCRISIIHNDNIYKILSIGYHKDGGYYISDLGDKSFNYMATKIITNIENEDRDGKYYIPFGKLKTYSIKLKKPKISHHIDGVSHISGSGIKSGYEKGKSKGLSIKSFNLNGYNDGGPIFICSVKISELNKFKKIKISDLDTKGNELLKKYHLLLPSNHLFTNKIYNDGNYSFIIEGYYIHKSDLPDGEYMNNNNTLIYINHPRLGEIGLIPIYTPDISPYIFGIYLEINNIDINAPLLSFGASPGLKSENGDWECISLVVFDKEPDLEMTNLNYKE